jgi:DNA modification methylase
MLVLPCVVAVDGWASERVVDMPLSQLDPYWQTRDEATVRLYHGDALEVLERLPSQSVHCAVTSPPYWNLRDYLTGTWQGGDSNCLHKPDEGWYQSQFLDSHSFTGGQINVKAAATRRWYRPDGSCRCGATRTDQQIGAESHPDLYVSRLVEVFRELRRVLRDQGTFWLDIGDTFGPKGDWKRPGMVGIPHRLAFALQDDGWILAMEHIHSKPAPMTESVTNRCTKSHNYVFMFVKKAGYFFDQFAIREKATPAVRKVSGKTGSLGQCVAAGVKPHGNGVIGGVMITGDTRNKRSVWTVSNSGYKGAHFATFSESLILPCIKAGTSEKGCCTECGAPWKRVVERTRTPTRPGENSKVYNGRSSGETGGLYNPPGQSPHSNARLAGDVTGNRDIERHVTSLRHLGWYPSCKCYGLQEIPKIPPVYRRWEEHRGESGELRRAPIDGVGEVHGYCSPDPTLITAYNEWVRQARDLCRQAEEEHGDSVEPCVVLDPFIGSGTTAVVCIGLGRYSMGIDLSEEYLKKNAVPRIEGELLGRPALASLVPR